MKKLLKYQNPAMALGNYYDFTPEQIKKGQGKISRTIMNGIHNIYNLSGGPTDVLGLYGITDSSGPLQDYFLTDKNTQNELILNSGLYIPGTDRDKKLSKRLFNGNYRVYRRGQDQVDRNKLIFLGLGDDGGQYALSSGIGDQELIDPGSYPSAWYVDNDGYLYRQSFDLNDYGGPGGSTSSIAGRFLDKIGNPIVQTTGLIKQIEEGRHINLFNDKDFENTEAYKSILNMLRRQGKTLERINGRMEITQKGPTIIKHRGTVISGHKNGGRLIPKAGLGDTLKRGAKKVINFVSRHAAPSREQTMFEVQNQQRIEGQKPRTLQDLQVDLKKLGYYTMTPDNKMGRGTRSAIQQAQDDGYQIDMDKFTISGKKKLQKRSTGSIEQLQQELADKGFYKGKIDGKVGTKTKAAITMAGINGYEVVDNKLVRKRLKTENIEHLSKQEGTYSVNNPIVRTVQDLFQARTNEQYHDVAMDPVTGMPLFTKPKSQTIKRIPFDQAIVLQELIKFKGSPKSGSFKSSDWKALQGTYTGGNRSVIERSFGALQSIEHCLGQFSWHTNDKGEVIVTDTFDWNVGSTSEGQGWYTKARDYMGKHGTLSTAPDDEKTKYEINIGKPENW